MLTGFVGAASVTAVSAFTHTKVVMCDCDKCKKEKKDKKCKDGSTCCKTKTAAADSKCSKDGAKKCCSSTKTNTAKTDSVQVK